MKDPKRLGMLFNFPQMQVVYCLNKVFPIVIQKLLVTIKVTITIAQ